VGASDRPVPPSCCGLAGDFGFARGHYEVSVAVAELELLPALRAEDAATTVLADGFSCRVQIEQLAGRRALHLAQLVDAALPRGEAPEGR
jgi:Fe-S oxidoreductase